MSFNLQPFVDNYEPFLSLAFPLSPFLMRLVRMDNKTGNLAEFPTLFFSEMVSLLISCKKWQCWPVADPGFPRGGGANSPGGSANIRFCHIFPKTAWNWKNLGRGGARPSCPPLDPPLLTTCYGCCAIWGLWLIYIARFQFRFGRQTKWLHCNTQNFLHCTELCFIFSSQLLSTGVGLESRPASVDVNKSFKFFVLNFILSDLPTLFTIIE